MLPPIETIVENFAFIDDWEERYRYLIELGRALPPADAALHAEANKVHGLRQPGLDRPRTSSVRTSRACTCAATATPTSCAASSR